MSDDNKSDLGKPTQLKQLQSNKIQKRLWVNLSREDFVPLINDVANNLDDNNCKTNMNHYAYNFKNADNFLFEVTARKISKNKARDCMMI